MIGTSLGFRPSKACCAARLHAQQALERAFEGLLVANGHIPKTHAIEELSAIVPIEGGWEERGAIKLDHFSIARYPDALASGSTARKHFTQKDAREATSITQGGMGIPSQWAASWGVPPTFAETSRDLTTDTSRNNASMRFFHKRHGSASHALRSPSRPKPPK